MSSTTTDQSPSRPNTHKETVATRIPTPSAATPPFFTDLARPDMSSSSARHLDPHHVSRPEPVQAARPRLPPAYSSPHLPFTRPIDRRDPRLGEQISHSSRPQHRLSPRQSPHQHQQPQAGPERRQPMVPVSRYDPYSDRSPPPPGLRRPMYQPPPPDRFPAKSSHTPARAEFAFPPRLPEIDGMMVYQPEAEAGGYQLSKGAQRDERWRSRQREREIEIQRIQRERARYDHEACYRERGHYPPGPESYDQRGRYDHGPDYTYPYRGGPYRPWPFRRSPFSPVRLPPNCMGGDDRRASLSSIASTLRRNSAVLYPEVLGVGPDVKGRISPRAEGAEREALLAEQERAIAAARKALAEERLKREKTGPSQNGKGISEQKAVLLPQAEMSEEDKVRRRRVQLQVFVHARPTYCRWGQCRAVLNSWALLEKHILHAHIKPLPQTLAPDDPIRNDTSATPSYKKSEVHCHWAKCTKVYADKERMYRHCLVEHMGEFCARCPFNCLFEGPTFPSLMAHISRRHPKATPDDFVPGLIHFEPHNSPPKPLPANETIQPITVQDPNGRPLYTPIVPAFIGQPAGSAHRLRLTKVVTMGCMSLCADHTGMKKEKKDARVAGRIIGEVVKLSVKAAEERRALKSKEDEASTEVSLSATRKGTEQIGQTMSDNVGMIIDVKTIAKQVKAAIKFESNNSRSTSPSSISKRSDSNEIATRTQIRAVNDDSVPGIVETREGSVKGGRSTLPDTAPKVATEGSRVTWDILIGAKPTPAATRDIATTNKKKDQDGSVPSPTPSQTPSSPSSSASEYKIRLKVPRPMSPTSAGLKRDLEAEEAEEVARRSRPRRQRL